MVSEIFAQVDDALKKRKLENLNLHDVITEREQQLTLLQQHTKEMSITNTSNNSALFGLKNAINQLEDQINFFQTGTLANVKEDCQYFENCFNECKTPLPI